MHKADALCEKRACLEKEELHYEYVLSGRDYIKIPQQFNQRFVGCTVLGEIVTTKGETMELDLRLKDEGETKKHYAYPWRPEAGNVFYCMPKAGAVVSLYFPSEDEKDAMAINCIRRESEENQANYDAGTKYFGTEDNKAMILGEESMHLVTETKEHVLVNEIDMIDYIGFRFNTSKGIKITCEGVEMESPYISVSAGTSQLIVAGTANAIGVGAALGAMVTGTYAVAAQASEDWKQGEGDPLGDAITETLAKTIGGAIEGGICALAGPMNWGEEAKELLGW